MIIKNINEVRLKNCYCGNWLKHWEKYSGQKAERCPALHCRIYSVRAAFVHKANGNDINWYVIPLCKLHSAYFGDLEISDDCKLVTTNIEETCKKKWI